MDEDLPEVIRNLRKARKSWDRLSRILGREGSSPRVSGMLFKEVVQAVIVFGAEAWVMTPHIGRYLGGVTTQGSSTNHWEAAPVAIAGR